MFEIDDAAGWLSALIKTDEGDCPVRLDALRCNNRFAALSVEVPDEQERADAWCQWLVAQGCPLLSHAAGFKVAAACIQRVKELDGTK